MYVSCTSISNLHLLFPCHSIACIDTSEKDVQAMTVDDSPDHLVEPWWMRRDSSKVGSSSPLWRSSDTPSQQPCDIHVALVLGPCMAKFFVLSSPPRGLTRTMHCIRVLYDME